MTEQTLANTHPAAASAGDELFDWDRRHFWHAFTQMAEYEPLIIERAEGSTLIDHRGRRYLDGVSSLWCNLHGHNHPRMNAAIADQLNKCAHATSLGMSNPPAIQLARRLAELTPGDLQHVFYASDGAAAVEAALKMAFQYWRQCPEPKPQKSKYVCFSKAYHGDTVGSTSVGGIERYAALFGPLLFDSVRLPSPSRGDLPEGVLPKDAAQHRLAELEAVLADQHEQIAAVVIEPLLQGAAGMVLQPEGYLRGVRELTERYNVLLIADEIVTGFGRTGSLFACGREEVTPDLLCLGKSLSGGYLPIAATVARPKIYDAFLGDYQDDVMFCAGHTFGGNPLAAAASLASLDLLLDEQMLTELVPQRSTQLAAALAPLAESPHVREIRQLGMIAGIELVADQPTDRHGYHVCRAATEAGVWLRPLGNVVVVMPPLVITPAEIDQIGQVVKQSIASVLDN